MGGAGGRQGVGWGGGGGGDAKDPSDTVFCKERRVQTYTYFYS